MALPILLIDAARALVMPLNASTLVFLRVAGHCFQPR
jgi:hypothetical protein